MNQPGKAERQSRSSPRRSSDVGTRGWGGDRRTQRVSHKLPKTRGVRLLPRFPKASWTHTELGGLASTGGRHG